MGLAEVDIDLIELTLRQLTKPLRHAAEEVPAIYVGGACDHAFQIAEQLPVDLLHRG